MPGLALAPLAAAALGPWTYAGFVTDADPPKVSPSAASTRVERPSGSVVIPTVATVPAALAIPPSVAPPVLAARRSGASDLRYRLADATGQVWEHADPNWLQSFVASRDSQASRFVRLRPACAGGTCR